MLYHFTNLRIDPTAYDALVVIANNHIDMLETYVGLNFIHYTRMSSTEVTIIANFDSLDSIEAAKDDFTILLEELSPYLTAVPVVSVGGVAWKFEGKMTRTHRA